MVEERFSRKIETKERLREADTDYLRKHGVRSVGNRDIYIIEETEEGIQLCGGSATRYYYDDKEPEDLPGGRACVLLPKEFLPELRAIVDQIISKSEAKKR